MFIRGVVDYHVEGQQHVALAQGTGHRAQVLERSGTFVQGAKVADRIAAVAGAHRAFQNGHHVQHIDAQFLQVVESGFQALQVAGKAVAVQCHADPFLAQEPVVILLALTIQFPEVGVACQVVVRQHLDESQHLRLEVLALAVEMVKQRMDRIEIRAETEVEMAQVLFADVFA